MVVGLREVMMFARKTRRLWCLAAFWLFVLTKTNSALGSPNATIVNANAQLRKSYPSFSVSALWRFQLEAGPTLTTIPKGSRVEVTKRIVVRTQEWFQTTYNNLTGWVYGGEVAGTVKYIQLDSGAKVPEASLDRHTDRLSTWLIEIRWDALPALYAQAPTDTVTPPSIPTHTGNTLLLGLGYVSVFIAALFVTKRWIFKDSNTYSFLTSLSVLLILGFISDNTFNSLLTKFLTATP
jgi:hypothetical protein